MLRSEAIKEKEKPTNKIFIILESKFIIDSPAPKVVAASNTGIDIINENFAAWVLEYPKYLAHVIVIPDLLVPGINARTCANPIYKAFLFEIFCS